MATAKEFTDAQLLQYSRQIMLPQIDVRGQQQLSQAKVVLLGAGGLGCPALAYLVASGVGEINLIDHDVVDASNLQRQILFRAQDVGRKKVDVARECVSSLNHDSNIQVLDQLPDEKTLSALFADADVVLDGTDNFDARYLHNRLCVQTHTPLVSGAVIRFEGQVSSFLNRNQQDPCYHCIYPNAQDEEQNCSENGVLGSVAGIIGSVMATEAIKIILNIGQSLNNHLLLLDALQMDWRKIQLKKDPACTVCAVKG